MGISTEIKVNISLLVFEKSVHQIVHFLCQLQQHCSEHAREINHQEEKLRIFQEHFAVYRVHKSNKTLKRMIRYNTSSVYLAVNFFFFIFFNEHIKQKLTIKS